MRAGSVLGVIIAVAGLGTFAACSAKHDPQPGEIFLAIDTNMKFPDDLDGLGVSVKNEVGVVSEDATFPLGPGDEAQFPATLAVIRGTTGPITIRVVGFKGTTPVTVREQITTIPAGRTALLHLDLSFLNAGMVQMPANATLVSELTVSCAAGTTPIGGACQPFTLDSATLPAYQPSLLGTSTGTSALDVDACLAGGTTVVPDSSTCTLSTPSTTSNIGLLLPASAGAGWCGGTSCVVPLLQAGTDGSQPDGWSLQADGLIHLPAGVCTRGYTVFTAPVTASCPSFSLQHPAQQSYGAAVTDAGTSTPDSGDSGVVKTPPVEAGSGDRVFTTRTGVTSFAVDDTNLYLLEGVNGTTTVEWIPALFGQSQAMGMTRSFVADITIAGSTVRFPDFAYVSGMAASNVVLDVDLNDGGTRSFGSGGLNPNAVALIPSSDGGTSLLYALSAAGVYGVDLGTPDAGPAVVDPNGSVIGTGRLRDGGTTLALAEPHMEGIQTGIIGDLTQVASMYGTDPAEIVATPEGEVFWKDTGGSLWLSSGGLAHEVAIAGASLDVGQTLAVSEGRVYWLDQGSSNLMTAVNNGATLGTAQPVPDLAGGTLQTSHVLVRNGMIYWLDGSNVVRETNPFSP